MTNRRHRRSWLLPGLVSFAIFLATGCPLPIYLPTSPKESVPEITLDAIPDSIHVGETATLKWEVKNSTHVEITPLGDVPSSGSRIVSPQSTTTYVLKATGPGGTSQGEKKVTVTPGAAPAPQGRKDGQGTGRCSVVGGLGATLSIRLSSALP